MISSRGKRKLGDKTDPVPQVSYSHPGLGLRFTSEEPVLSDLSYVMVVVFN
jgi:hypothetical protein